MLGYSVRTLGGANGTDSGTDSGTGKIVETFAFLTGLYSRPVRMSAEDDAALTVVPEWFLAYNGYHRNITLNLVNTSFSDIVSN